MRVTFSTPDGNLRIIPTIPDLPLARLEGRNGIGKTLAARLLELISGQPPYAGLPRAWKSLVEQLGRVRIEIEEIGHHSILVMLDSNDWDVDNQSNAVINPGQVYLDGNAVSWDDLRSILQVRRIAGDETLGETIGLALYQKSLDVEIVYKRVLRRPTTGPDLGIHFESPRTILRMT